MRDIHQQHNVSTQQVMVHTTYNTLPSPLLGSLVILDHTDKWLLGWSVPEELPWSPLPPLLLLILLLLSCYSSSAAVNITLSQSTRQRTVFVTFWCSWSHVERTIKTKECSRKPHTHVRTHTHVHTHTHTHTQAKSRIQNLDSRLILYSP